MLENLHTRTEPSGKYATYQIIKLPTILMYLMLKKSDLHMADAITRVQLLSYQGLNGLHKDSTFFRFDC